MTILGDYPREFMMHARCRDEGDAMFPDQRDHHGIRRAQSICAMCPVLAACEDYRDKTNPTDGVWAGEYVHLKPPKTKAGILKPCGTSAAYTRHIARGEKPCEPCTRANRIKNTDYYAKYQAKAAQ